MISCADDDRVVGFLDLRSFDGKGEGVTIKKELKEVDALAHE